MDTAALFPEESKRPKVEKIAKKAEPVKLNDQQSEPRVKQAASAAARTAPARTASATEDSEDDDDGLASMPPPSAPIF